MSTGQPSGRHRVTLLLLVEIGLPLGIFYGARAVGINPFLALLLGAIPPVVSAMHTLATSRKVNGVSVFVLATMTLTVLMSLVSGSARVLLVRDAWATAAMGLWFLATLLARKPLIYEGARLIFDDAKRQAWDENWQRFPEFRRAMRVCTAVWAGAFLLHTLIRVGMALWLPIDVVPATEPVLLALTVLALVVFHRYYGRSFLRRHGLRWNGVKLEPQTTAPTGLQRVQILARRVYRRTSNNGRHVHIVHADVDW